MALIGRIIAVSVLTGALGATLGIVIAGSTPDAKGVALMLGCVAAIIGAVAAAARENAYALHQKPFDKSHQ